MHDAKNKQYIETKPGSVVVFPCHIMHGVEPVTAGERKSIVTWLVGPPLK
jgi:PKHD-type hydroxylase